MEGRGRGNGEKRRTLTSLVNQKKGENGEPLDTQFFLRGGEERDVASNQRLGLPVNQKRRTGMG